MLDAEALEELRCRRRKQVNLEDAKAPGRFEDALHERHAEPASAGGRHHRDGPEQRDGAIRLEAGGSDEQIPPMRDVEVFEVQETP